MGPEAADIAGERFGFSPFELLFATGTADCPVY